MPPAVPFNHYSGSENQQNRTEVLFHYSMQDYSSAMACFEHSNFFKVKDPDTTTHPVKGDSVLRMDGRRTPAHILVTETGQVRRTRNPTTSFLTATILIYAIGAGITAAAGH